MKVILLVLTFLVLSSCRSTYYKAWEYLGHEKRDLLISKLSTTKKSQAHTKKQVRDILTEIKNRYGTKESEVDKFYQRLKNDYNSFHDQTIKIKKEANDIRTIANDLFEEWHREAQSFQNKNYKKQSLYKLKKTKESFNKLSKKLEQSENQLEGVDRTLKDQVLFIKHNLNTRSLIVFSNEISKIELEIQTLIQKMNFSLEETQNFELTLN